MQKCICETRVLAAALALMAFLPANSIGQPATKGAAGQTVEVSGHVSRADNGNPIAGAWIVIEAAFKSGGNERKHTQTDSRGFFTFSGLKPGDYELVAGAPTFVIQHYSGNRTSRGAIISLGRGQVVSNINLALARGAIIAGTVRTEAGRPVSGISVSAVRVLETGEPLSWRVPAMLTDSQGGFRLVDLQSGRYRICLNLPNRKPDSIAEAQHYPKQCFPEAGQNNEQLIQLSPGEEAVGIRIRVPKDSRPRTQRFPAGFRFPTRKSLANFLIPGCQIFYSA